MKTHLKTFAFCAALIGLTSCNANNKKQPELYAEHTVERDVEKKESDKEPNKQFIINITEPSVKLTYEAPGKKRGIIINFLVFFILLISVYRFKNIKL